jgi:molybdopterin-guanine dinucleotide biosynthesis protein A
MLFDIPLVIFAGGKSSRMGQDKALMPFGSYSTLALYQHDRLSQLFGDIYISSKDNKFDFDAQIICDRYNDIRSPLVGLISVFEELKQDLFILSVDAPFINQDIFESIIQQHSSAYDATIAQSPNGLEPLCGIYSPSITNIAKKNLQNDNHSLTNLLRNSNTKFITFEDEDLFMNLNYQEDYQKAKRIML